MFCPKCGTEIKERVNFCPKCGAQLTDKRRISQRRTSGLAIASLVLGIIPILGIGAIILGLFKLKDFFWHKTVCIISPRVDKIVSKITSPRGAFLAGAFVTIFLLPCTVGPYIICGGILCPLGILKALPWLLLYNLIFVLPMLAVVLIIYLGLSKIEDISSWQARNIKYLNLITGLIVLGLGMAMILGLI